jgi:GNAT superfamily N-acetyltransferase
MRLREGLCATDLGGGLNIIKITCPTACGSQAGIYKSIYFLYIMNITVSPLTTVNWKDFELLFGPNGACAGCWCMYWRLSKKAWKENQGAGNKKKIKQLVGNGVFTGLIAYIDGEPAGWCSLGPREEFPVLEKSKTLGRFDDQPVLSVVCFYIHKDFRRKGVSEEILLKVVDYAKKKKIQILEGYPVVPNKENYPATFAWTGFYNSFLKAGFKEVIRRSPTRPIMRYIF